MAFNVFVLDYGMMWVAGGRRRMPPTPARSAGAVARGYDDFANPPSSTGRAARSATQTAAANLIWQQPGTAAVSFDCPAGVTGRCVQVNVYRDGSFGSTALPTVFGPILGVDHARCSGDGDGVRPSTAMRPCLRPFAFADDWDEHRSPNDRFNRYFESGANAGMLLSGPRDVYFRPARRRRSASTSRRLRRARQFPAGHDRRTTPITRWAFCCR